MNDIEVLKKLLADAERIEAEISNLNCGFFEWYEGKPTKIKNNYEGKNLNEVMFQIDNTHNEFLITLNDIRDLIECKTN